MNYLKMRSLSDNYNYINCDKYNSVDYVLYYLRTIGINYILVEFNIYNIKK